jgi:UDP-GlcNAc:undecaprenyl-phosphate/decaprenyl-phosphate GlcNAc-1-phosphate transferase
MFVQLGVAICVASVVAYFATPLAIVTAQRLSFYDRPAGYKSHSRPTPYLGGAAVVLAFAIAIMAAARDRAASLSLIGALAVLLVVGTVDDRRSVPPAIRVICEFGLGIGLSALDLGWQLGTGGVVDAIVTGIWVVGVVNAFNLFDNMDGASTTMALASSAGICALGLVTGNAWVVAGSAALCGACLGFLPHNLSSPAKIFLGDGGSMPLGFAVAVLAANAAQSAEPGFLALLVGCLLVGVPALDTALVIVSRTRRRISVLTGGRDHLTHRTRMRMKTPGRVALVLGGAQALVSAMVIVASQAGSPELVYIVLAFFVLAVSTIVALEEAIPFERVGGRAETDATPARLQPAGAARVTVITLAVVGFGAGLSPLFSAYYSPSVWMLIGFVLMVVAAMAMIARPPRIGLPTALVLVALSGLGLWSLLSMTWAQAVEQATLGGNLWLSYAALVLLVVIMVGRRQHAVILLGAAGLGIAVVAASVLVRLLGSDPGTLFIAGRINSPLGYINGEGCVFALGVWFGLALAEQRRPVWAGLGTLISVVMAGLVLLSQSRGAAIASAVALVVTVLVIPGRVRRILAITVIVCGFAAAASSVAHVYSVGVLGTVPATVAHHAVVALVLAALAAGIVWGGVVAVANLIKGRGESAAAGLRRTAAVLAAIVILVPLVVAAVRSASLERTTRQQWHAFVHLGTAEGSGASAGSQTRLFSGAGNRYDYWRVAWKVFSAHPVVGVGAGNYTPYYFRYRRTVESIENPHSLELQTLSELGVIGGILLLVLIGGTGLAVARLAPSARRSPLVRGTLVAGTGVSVVWLVDSSGDWMHLLPGVTAIALCAIAALAACTTLPDEGEAAASSGPRVERRQSLTVLFGSAVVILVLAIGGASLLRDALARHYVSNAQSALANDPATAISTAQRALSLDPAELDAYYVKAAGQARFNNAAAARDTLLAATQQDPGDFITWTLFGDLEVRAGDIAGARDYYQRALHLDPREPALRALVNEPARRLLKSAQ